MATSKIQRWLDLLAVLVGRRMPVPIEDIMEEVPGYRDRWQEGDERSRESVRRMFERDKDELRDLGIPLETRRYRVEGREEAEGYLVPRKDLYLPYLELISREEEDPNGQDPPPTAKGIGRVRLSEEDARIATAALRNVITLPSFPFGADARSALRKLTFDLDPALRDPVGSLNPRVRILDRPGGADPQDALGTLLEALYDRKMVRLRYHSIGRDDTAERDLEPWGLLFHWSSWYLVGRDSGGHGEESLAKLFRVDRMDGVRLVSPGASGPEFDIPEDFDVRAYTDREAWELEQGSEASEIEVRVRFLPPLSLLAARNGWGESVGEEHAEEGAEVRTFRVRRLDPFLRWVLSFAGEAEIVDPPMARAGLERMAGWVMDLYREVE